MKIAMMVRGYISAPQPADIVYAPINLAINIAEGLAKRGHQVDFYGPQGTKLSTNVRTLRLRPLVRNLNDFQEFISKPDLMAHYVLNLWDGVLALDMFKRAADGKYDLLYFIHPEVSLLLSQTYPDVPLAYTLHDPINKWYQEVFKMYKTPHQHFITISDSQRRAAPQLSYSATVYNGLDAEQFPFSESHDDYLLYVGRIVPEKGIYHAIQVAKRTNHKLLIIGPVYKDTQNYFNRYIKPYLDDRIQYLGYTEHDKLGPYYRKAKAFLTPLQWEEPFGMTMLESMASGTPVIALNRGSAPEIVVNGKTGFVVNTIDEMVAAVAKIDKIDRKACREHVIKNFSIDRMVDGYEKAFLKILDQKY